MKLPSKEQQERIESIIYSRFYNRIRLYDIYQWLSNFEEYEMDNAIDIMEHIIYFRESDIVDMLRKIFKLIFSNYNADDSVMYLMPLGEPGKSGDAMMYCVQKVFHSIIRKFKDSIFFINYPEEIDKVLCEKKKNVYVVLLDDIIGSGSSFDCVIKDGNGNILKEWEAILLNEHVKTMVVAPVILESGKNKISRECPHVCIKYAEIYQKAFEKKLSVFGGYVTLLRLREFCYKYGILLDSVNPLGWKNSQALVVFDHATPNNTLPIIWSNRYVKSLGKNWYPLFPRSYNVVGKRAFAERTDNNRWISMLVRILLKDELEGMDFIERKKWLSKYFTKDSYNLFLILRMLMKNESDYRIANTLAITSDDLNRLYKDGVGRLWNVNHSVTDEARTAYDEVEKQIMIERTKANHEHPQKVNERGYVYTPETFKNLK